MPVARLCITWDCSTSNMEKIFNPKILVIFCAIFIVVWVMLQTFSNMRIEAEAQLIGDTIFNWEWPEECRSNVQIEKASIIKKSDNDAVVKVSGKQILTPLSRVDPLDNSSPRSQTVDCSATLTLYKKSDHWVLGRVEF